MEELLRMEGVSKQFGEFYANRGVDFEVRAGEVHTLLGENGAGKSTLMKAVEDGSFGNKVVTGDLANGCVYLGAFNNAIIDSATQAKITDAVKKLQAGTFGK